jgi:hypothetical protein
MKFKNIVTFTTFAFLLFVNPSFSQSGNSVLDRNNQLRQREVQRNINVLDYEYRYSQSVRESEQRASFSFWASIAASIAVVTGICVLGYKELKKDRDN